MTEKIVAQCSVNGCLKTVYCKEMCRSHYKLAAYYRKKNNPDTPRCLIVGCELPSKTRGWCNKHYSCYQRTGDPLLFKRKTQGSTHEERFWKRVDVRGRDECWEWQNSKTQGYGDVWIDGKSWKAHRYAWFLAHKTEPTLMILHSCDNPPCCNPQHLREGTNQDNMNDMVMRGRHPFRQPLDINTYKQIQMLVTIHSVAKVCDLTGVGRNVIDKIKHGTHWTCKVYGDSN